MIKYLKPKRQNDGLLKILERNVAEYELHSKSNVTNISGSNSTERLDPHEFHQQTLQAIQAWDDSMIEQMRYYFMGVRNGWLQAGKISAIEYEKMLYDIDIAVINRIKGN